MDSLQLIVRLTERQIDSLFRAARALPADRLDWKPAPGARSALDQLQEVATAYDKFQDAYTKRKITWDPQDFATWLEERAKITDIDELERLTRDSTARFFEFLKTISPEDLTLPVEMPFPGDYTLADIAAYIYWNATYHEGQIYYIGTLIEQGG